MDTTRGMASKEEKSVPAFLDPNHDHYASRNVSRKKLVKSSAVHEVGDNSEVPNEELRQHSMRSNGRLSEHRSFGNGKSSTARSLESTHSKVTSNSKLSCRKRNVEDQRSEIANQKTEVENQRTKATTTTKTGTYPCAVRNRQTERPRIISGYVDSLP